MSDRNIKARRVPTAPSPSKSLSYKDQQPFSDPPQNHTVKVTDMWSDQLA